MSFVGGMDKFYKMQGRRLKEIEETAKRDGRQLNDKYYDLKDRYESSKSHYEDLKRRKGY